MVKIFHQRCFQAVFLCVFSLITLSFTDPGAVVIHPFFVSVVEINHNPSEKTLEISCKIFTDDFQKALGKISNSSVDLINPKDRAATEKLISTYISDHLSLVADNKPVTFRYLGYEISEDAAWCYLQADHISSVKNLDISNKILHDFTDKQINIIHATVNGGRKSSKLEYPKSSVSFSF